MPRTPKRTNLAAHNPAARRTAGINETAAHRVARLSQYLQRLFFSETFTLAVLVVVLLYLVQCFRILDVVTVKGQDLLTLFGQAALSIPLIGKIFFYIAVGIGLTRSLTALQANGELHIIHSSGRLRGLMGAIGLFTTGWVVIVLLLAHVVSPISMRSYEEWAAGIAADLVARALVPHRFVEVVPGVTVSIASREGAGGISGFFADDRRDPEQRRTYTARSAIVARTDEGYLLQMQDGSVQYMTADGRFSEIRFAHYDLSIGRLTDLRSPSGNLDSITLVQQALASGEWSESLIGDLAERTGEGLRVIGMCLLITGLAAFPSGRRRGLVPMELAVLIITFFDRSLSTYSPGWLGPFRVTSGALVMIACGLLLLAWRFLGSRLPFRSARRRRGAVA